MRRRDEIIENIGKKQEIAAQKALVSAESLIRDCERIQLQAERLEQPSAAVAALIAKAKLAGLWVEKSERRTTHVDDNQLTDREIIEKIREIEREEAALYEAARAQRDPIKLVEVGRAPRLPTGKTPPADMQ